MLGCKKLGIFFVFKVCVTMFQYPKNRILNNLKTTQKPKPFFSIYRVITYETF